MASLAVWSAEKMEKRIVRYRDLRPCLNAFIDTRTPGSEAKENFTVIGPGVSENPAQHVHIAEPHGFNIGGARQPPGCANSQHSHETAEVVIVHSGDWRFDFGENADDAHVLLHAGDLVSVPTRVFRGFTNVGAGVGYLFFILGGDDPGRVLWAPRVFELAKDYGLVLMEDGRLVDTAAGEPLPAAAKPMPPTTKEEVEALRRVAPGEGESFVARASSEPGRATLIGPDGPLAWPHGFRVERWTLAAGERTEAARVEAPEVLFVHEGEVRVAWDEGEACLAAGDTVTVPIGLERALESEAGATVFLVRGDA